MQVTIELIEKKNSKPMTRFKFKRKDFDALPEKTKEELKSNNVVNISSRYVSITVLGDLLNGEKKND